MLLLCGLVCGSRGTRVRHVLRGCTGPRAAAALLLGRLLDAVRRRWRCCGVGAARCGGDALHAPALAQHDVVHGAHAASLRSVLAAAAAARLGAAHGLGTAAGAAAALATAGAAAAADGGGVAGAAGPLGLLGALCCAPATAAALLRGGPLRCIRCRWSCGGGCAGSSGGDPLLEPALTLHDVVLLAQAVDLSAPRAAGAIDGYGLALGCHCAACKSHGQQKGRVDRIAGHLQRTARAIGKAVAA